jgi:hypothetical protein
MRIRNKIFLAILFSAFLSLSTVWGAQIGGVVKDKGTARGIAHVVVRAAAVDSKSKVFETRTDRSGAFNLKVDRGHYQVQAIPTGTNYLPGFFAMPNAPTVPAIIDLVAEDVFTFANISLDLGGSIEGRVARLLDGAPLENVRISAESDSHRFVTTTNQHGRYVLRALPPDSYAIEAGVLDSNYIPSFYPRMAFREQAGRIIVHPDDRVSGIDLKLEFGGIIKGRILSATTNQPLSNIMAIAVPFEGNLPERFAYTDEFGSFSIHGLAAGKYRIEAGDERETTEEGTKQHRHVTQFFESQFDRELAQPVELASASTVTGIDFKLYRGNQIRGRVQSGFYDIPLPNVIVQPVFSPESKLRLSTGLSDFDGNYLIDGLPPGNYVVTVDLPEDSRQHVATWFRDQIVRKKATTITVRDGDTYPNADFNLRLGGIVSGRVTADDPEYRLEYKRLHMGISTVRNEIDGFEPRVYDLSDEGLYSIVGAPVGRFQLAVTSEDPNLMIGQSGDIKTIVISEGREIRDLDFTVRVGGSISGKVILKRSRLPIDRYRILLLRTTDQYHEFYKINGDSYTIPGLRPGKYVLILVEEQEPMTLDKLFSGPRWYDTRFAEVKKGEEVTNVDFVVDEGQPLTIP